MGIDCIHANYVNSLAINKKIFILISLKQEVEANESKFLESSEAFEELSIRSQIGIMAYHGGTLEKATDAIARETAEQTELHIMG